jgi:hypothetical protein
MFEKQPLVKVNSFGRLCESLKRHGGVLAASFAMDPPLGGFSVHFLSRSHRQK